MASQQPQPSARIGLFVTCLVDLFRPAVGFAAVKLLEDAGFRVEVPEAQTCCGQPAYNSGDLADTRAIARQVITAFEPFDYVVTPSGSCGGQLHKYPELFADEPDWQRRARTLALCAPRQRDSQLRPARVDGDCAAARPCSPFVVGRLSVDAL